MTETFVRLACDQTDIEAARDLCWEWSDWHWENYPDEWPREGDPDWLTGVEHPMGPATFEKTMADLPERHSRPRGGILIAFLNGTPAGCVMYNEARPGVTEFHRMFVSVGGRGKGLGKCCWTVCSRR